MSDLLVAGVLATGMLALLASASLAGCTSSCPTHPCDQPITARLQFVDAATGLPVAGVPAFEVLAPPADFHSFDCTDDGRPDGSTAPCRTWALRNRFGTFDVVARFPGYAPARFTLDPGENSGCCPTPERVEARRIVLQPE